MDTTITWMWRRLLDSGSATSRRLCRRLDTKRRSEVVMLPSLSLLQIGRHGAARKWRRGRAGAGAPLDGAQAHGPQSSALVRLRAARPGQWRLLLRRHRVRRRAPLSPYRRAPWRSGASVAADRGVRASMVHGESAHESRRSGTGFRPARSSAGDRISLGHLSPHERRRRAADRGPCHGACRGGGSARKVLCSETRSSLVERSN